MTGENQEWLDEEETKGSQQPIAPQESDDRLAALAESNQVTDRRGFYKRDERWFKPGRVIQYFHYTPYGNDSENTPEQSGSSVSVMVCGERVYVKRQIGIIMTKRKGISYLIPINTYGRRGVLKKGTPAETHAVVCSEGTEAEVDEEEYTRGLHPKHIRISTSSIQIRSKSRVNFGETLTLSHNQDVKHIGAVVEEHWADLKTLWKQHAPGRESD